MPHGEEPVRRALALVGVPVEHLSLAEALVAACPRSAPRLAADPSRFGALLDASRPAPANSAVLAAVQRARLWRPSETLVLPPRAKHPMPDALRAFEDATLPFLVAPLEPRDTSVFAIVALPIAANGLYECTYSDFKNVYAYVWNVSDGGERPAVVGVARDGAFSAGADDVPPGVRTATAWRKRYPSLAMMDAFAQRLTLVAFNGDSAWSDENLVRALSLAERAVFAFGDLGGDKAKKLCERIKAIQNAP
jgi:hypothetical protein